jgi:hypothetical protein
VQYTDWGERAVRWSGIRSETVDVHGTEVHYLVTDQTPTSEAPVHLLVPNPANSASNWLDVLAELRAHTHAIAVDLPGTIAGHCALPNRRAASIEANVRFLRDFADACRWWAGLGRQARLRPVTRCPSVVVTVECGPDRG